MKKAIIIILSVIIILLLILYNKQKSVHESALNVIYENTSTAQNMVQTENSMENTTIPQKQENSLEGKTVALIGDSLIEGYGNDFKGLDYYLAEKLPNTNFINNSKSGSTVTDNSGEDNIVMMNQAKTLEGNPDIIAFDGGANDIMGYSLGFLNNELKKETGTVDMNTEKISETDSVINDFEEVVQELKIRFPNAKLCYVQMFLLDNETISHLTQDETARQEIKQRRDLLFSEIQKMCIKWEIKYVDVTEKFEDTGLTYRQDDWTHIKEEGYRLLTDDIINKLKEM